MAKSNTFQCSVITPEKTVLETAATFAAFPAHDGELGVMVNRAPLVCKLGIGLMRIEAPDKEHFLMIDGGFAQVVGNRLTILTEQARKASEVDAAGARQAMVEARAMPITDDASFQARDKAIRRAEVQLKLVESSE